MWFLLGLWSLMMLNSVLYRHSHRLPNGKIVSHAHPYQKSADNSPAQPHEHTDEELALLQLIDGQLFEPPAVVAINFAAFQCKKAINNFFYNCFFPSSHSSFQAGRAPPQY